ncbi:MAG: hydrogenase iron-sulfur subunit [Acidobacteriota bacterium]|nr:hydrogenase iron-sulfur subunit [Acidobacteriota bacterium]
MITERFEPKIVAFLCNWCSYRAADLAGTARTSYASNVRIVRVMCSGRVDPAFVLKAFGLGADGVVIAGCHPGECHYLEQNFKTLRRHAMLRHVLRSLGIEKQRIQLVWASAAEGRQLAAAFDRVTEEVRQLGPLRWRANWLEDEAQSAAVERVAEEHAESMEVRP